MNDQHPNAGYDAYATGSFDTDPLFGALPGSYEAGHGGHSGQYDATQWNTGSATGYDTFDAQAHQQAYPQQYDATQYDTTGQWDANAWNQTGQFATGQYETAAATFAYDTTGQWPAAGYGTASAYETGTYDATAWNSGAEVSAEATAAYPQYVDTQQYAEHIGYAEQHLDHVEHSAEQHLGHTEHAEPAEYAEYPVYDGHQDLTEAVIPEQFSPADEFDADPTAATGSDYDYGYESDGDHDADYDSGHDYDADTDTDSDSDSELVADADTATAPAVIPSAAVPIRPVRRAGGSRGRRRTPAKRSALLTVAVPSACVMGVAGVAAASVGGLTSGGETKDADTAVTAADPSSVKPVAANNKLDTQLAALSADARDFGDRASRTQERIDLKERQEAERKKREEEAARREALRPKFALPVAQHGLSAYYGQAGVNWMSMHTGIDFPVSYGTPVMAATDGTVRTQWNSAYGNMAIVTAADGTETWYCHLSSTKIRSGSVKAGEVIAYSGNSGNSTGPHLHFEVRPGGGSAIDPLPWLRSHGLSPT
ncbi:M23 family metallopeptidase [Streptomyces sp. NPDC054841]